MRNTLTKPTVKRNQEKKCERHCAKSSITELKVNSAQDTKVTKNRLSSKENSARDTNLNNNQLQLKEKKSA